MRIPFFPTALPGKVGSELSLTRKLLAVDPFDSLSVDCVKYLLSFSLNVAEPDRFDLEVNVAGSFVQMREASGRRVGRQEQMMATLTSVTLHIQTVKPAHS